ncbi:MAG: S41 family peptidase [Bacteroidota bacterium]
MKTARILVTVMVLIIGMSKQTGAQRVPPPLPKMSAAPLVEDILLLKKILEANHPSLYWYTSKDSIDYYFNETIAGITDSLNEMEYKNRLSKLVAHIRCGHTTVRFSKVYGKVAAMYRYPQFPLALKVWDDSLVVLGSAYRNDSIFKRGTIVTAINQRTPVQLLDTMYQYISTDGYGINHKSQVISGNFPGWYKTILGDADSVYTIRYIDSTGIEKETMVKAYRPVLDTSRQGRQETRGRGLTRREIRKLNLLNKRSMLIDTAASTAFIRLTTFTGGRLTSFFRRSFKTLSKLAIQHLVIDLRENGGGKVSNSIRLAQYLIDKSFKVGDTVAAISRKLEYGRYIKPTLIYWIAMNFGARKEIDGRIHYRRYEQHYYVPKVTNHFNGKVYLIQGGYTFSAATMFIAQLQGQPNVKVLGEETGGGYYGNSAMHIPKITLPNSGIVVSLPMYRLVMDKHRVKGRGIMPDVMIKPSSKAIREGYDIKIKEVKKMIGQ